MARPAIPAPTMTISSFRALIIDRKLGLVMRWGSFLGLEKFSVRGTKTDDIQAPAMAVESCRYLTYTMKAKYDFVVVLQEEDRVGSAP